MSAPLGRQELVVVRVSDNLGHWSARQGCSLSCPTWTLMVAACQLPWGEGPGATQRRLGTPRAGEGPLDPHTHLPQPPLLPTLLAASHRDRDTEYSWLNIVGSSQHPLGVDEGPPTKVYPQASCPIVEPQAHLPQVAPGRDIAPPPRCVPAHVLSWGLGKQGKGPSGTQTMIFPGKAVQKRGGPCPQDGWTLGAETARGILRALRGVWTHLGSRAQSAPGRGGS